MISAISDIPSAPVSSILPINGDTYVAPAFAAISAWDAEKIRVTFVFIPSAVKILLLQDLPVYTEF